MNKLTNKILKSISEAIQFSLDDFDDEDTQIQNIKNRQKSSDESTIIQRGIVNTQLTQKAFIYELLKRLPGVDKKLFTPFGFINYKVTGNYSDWPYLVSTNNSMSQRTLEKYQYIFDAPGWTTVINDSNSFEWLLYILSDRYFKNYKTDLFDTQYPRGESAYTFFVEKNKWWLEAFKGKYNECHGALIKLAKAHEFLNEEPIFYINQISLSNDGAFIVIFYQWIDKKDYNYRYSLDIFSTNKLVDEEKGINVDEYKDVKSNQIKFKNYLTKNIIKRFGDLVFSKLLVADNINNHAAFVYEAQNNSDFPWQSRTWWKSKEAYALIRKCMPYNDVTYNLGAFMFFSLNHNYYIEDNYHGSNDIYENLIYKGRKPYIVVSSQSGEYLVAFYSNYIDYRKYSLTYAIIDNRDYKLMPKEFLKEIEYNEISL